ncbi:sulfotransferase [Paracoccus albus]|uniref:sulfotransferase n=1 Tax=Paracoccus albus TaxID=3017784 RepID=UPI0022F00315|nr:sulfotransferase [Paracoccus albus]WBU61054.1 sulfotransferase [Paracoccus albus]
MLAITLPHLEDHPDAAFDDLRPMIDARAYGTLADHYLFLFRTLAARRSQQPTVWAERSGGSLTAAGILLRRFTKAKLIVLLRSGAETALSLRDYAPGRMAIWLWKYGFGLIDPISPTRHLGRGVIWPVLSRMDRALPLNRILNRQPSLRDCGSFWSALMQRGEAALRNHPITTLRHADLMSDPVETTRHLGNAVAGSAPASWVGQASKLPQRRRSRLLTLSPQDLDCLLEACASGEAAAERLYRRGKS